MLDRIATTNAAGIAAAPRDLKRQADRGKAWTASTANETAT